MSKEKAPTEAATAESNGEHPTSDTNGASENGPNTPTTSASESTEAAKGKETPAESISEPGNGTDGTDEKKSRGIPETIKLYEIFFEQVMNLVNAQHLPIQDTTALLVSLAYLKTVVNILTSVVSRQELCCTSNPATIS